MSHVWICQCLCPDRHAMMAAAAEVEDEATAQTIRSDLKRGVNELIQSGVMNPWCGLCGATLSTWSYELQRTKWATMLEAVPHLQQAQEENLATNAAWSDLHLTDRPN